MGFFAVATLLQSNWFGTLSAILLIRALTWQYGGAETADQLRGPTLLLLLAMPIPLNFDLKLIIALQKIASLYASRLLDFFQVRHNISGVALTMVDRTFMVEEACSGVHSLFSCLCAIIFVAVMRRYSLPRTILNAVQTVSWVVVANAVRVFLVVYSHDQWGIAIDTGWRHELVGVFTYVLALLMALSCDRLFGFLVPVVSEADRRTTSDYEKAGDPFSQIRVYFGQASRKLERWLDKERTGGSTAQWFIVSVLIFAFGPLSLTTSVAAMERWTAADTVTSDGDVPQLPADEIIEHDFQMPQAVNSWVLTDTENVTRKPDDPLGQQSRQFTYTGPGLVASFSIDGFYPAWHDLAYCYSALNWKLLDQSNFLIANQQHTTKLMMYTDDGRQLLSFFSCFDSKGTSVAPGQLTIGVIQTLETLSERLGWKTRRRENRQKVVGPVFQMQLTCTTEHELLEHEQKALQQLFSSLVKDALKNYSGAAK